VPYRITRFEATPNPNALKCHLDRALEGPNRSYRRREEAGEDDAVARALFAVEGVAGLLLMGDWLTVNKRPEAEWARLKRQLMSALADVP